MERKLIEAALFISQKPLDLHELAKITGMSSLGFLKESLDKMQKEYEDRGIEIIESQGTWQMQVRPELLPKVASLTKYQDLPEGPKRSLALILYKEPVKQSEVIHIQGNKAYSYIKRLKKLGLITSKKEGHTKILSVTKELENYFGQKKEAIKEQFAALEQQTEEPKTPEKE
ncbi:MAG: SMC-Scp complex subunit ScpB [Candidatus Aenigmarchaeota archaeon]|nr:SMC-Scp complex subunit ScpB [Candidatus Aenigmarchaeota archaeon]